MARTRTDWLRWGVRARRHPSAFLLAAQLVSLILYPLFDEMRGGRVLFGALGVVVLMLAVWVVERSPAKVWIAWLLVVPALLLSVASVVLGSDNLLVLSSALEALLYLYAAASLIAYMLGDHRVTSDELYAAGATFTLLAWGFAYAYFVCQAWYPGSFTGAVRPERPAHLAGAAVPEFHHALGDRTGRHHSAVVAGAGAGDARAVRRRGVHRGGRVQADRPDHPQARRPRLNASFRQKKRAGGAKVEQNVL